MEPPMGVSVTIGCSGLTKVLPVTGFSMFSSVCGCLSVFSDDFVVSSSAMGD